MATFLVIDTSASGDYFDDGMVKDAANWATLEAGLPVINGGTGRATGTTAYALVAVGTTATGAQQSLAAGATTEILVGGGASALPVWTTATGTGAPVRATSPTLVTPLLGTPTSGNLSNCTLTTPPAIGETTPNTIRGTNVEIFKTASADSPLTAAQCSGTIVSNYGMTDADCTIDLPTAAAGLSFVCVLPAVRARFFKLHCPAAQADKIYLLGVAGSDDGNVGVASGYATGSAASFFTFKASDGGYDWFCIPIYGTWVAS